MKTKQIKLIKSNLLLIIIGLFAITLIANCGSKNKEAVLKDSAPPQAETPEQLNAKIDELTNQIIKNMTQKKKSKIAVIEFTDLNKKVTDFGRFLSEKLITKLFLTGSFLVIERNQLEKVMSEHKLNLSGTVDPASAKRLGKILGVDAIATGTITDMGQNLDVNARLIDTETASIFAVASVTIKKDSAVLRLMGGEDTSPKAQAEAKEVSFNNIKVENEYIRVELKLISGRIEKDGKIVLNLLQTNLMREDESTFFLEEEETYLVDESGKRYALHSYSSYILNRSYPRMGRMLKLPPNVPYKVSLAFSGGNTDASVFSLVLKLGQFARMGGIPLETGSARKIATRETIVINEIRLR